MNVSPARKEIPGEYWWSRPISHQYTTTCMLAEQAEDLLRLNYQAERWTPEALKLQCARQAGMIASLAAKNARQRLELRKLNRVLARRKKGRLQREAA